ncbi:hypothetical protein PR048_021617 [Dryococelus australis]|uniref:Chitobiosyldiphosphodolichol beta-mannosyltransferase n=1 Tax=Dryococelus australis TaxID=614101 RepID=A0ABQ9GYP4_9NEOP|nr:hypothetical protein PR048_021617 [Dryococelus australis]
MLKAMWQTFSLLFALLLKRKSHHVVVQNVPAVPTLAVCWFYCLLAHANFIIDWHNYGFSILALTLGEAHILVKVSRWFEGYFGQKACSNLCVTKAMKDDLKERWNISVSDNTLSAPPAQADAWTLPQLICLWCPQKTVQGQGAAHGSDFGKCLQMMG